tara:strand:+ start:856 stop:1068 length:213 start_codon:yes stop_codon:yes gene_type:complete
MQVVKGREKTSAGDLRAPNNLQEQGREKKSTGDRFAPSMLQCNDRCKMYQAMRQTIAQTRLFTHLFENHL